MMTSMMPNMKCIWTILSDLGPKSKICNFSFSSFRDYLKGINFRGHKFSRHKFSRNLFSRFDPQIAKLNSAKFTSLHEIAKIYSAKFFRPWSVPKIWTKTLLNVVFLTNYYWKSEILLHFDETIAKINSAKSLWSGQNAKINSAKLTIFALFNRENKFRENLCPRKFMPLR